MKIYMDVCCLNRPFDDQGQDRIFLETQAILSSISRCEKGEWALVSSGAIEYELDKMRDEERLESVKTLLAAAQEYLDMTKEAEELAARFQRHGLKSFDSLHLALAQLGGADVFLTVDDQLLNAAQKMNLSVAVNNPVAWLMEVEQNGW